MNSRAYKIASVLRALIISLTLLFVSLTSAGESPESIIKQDLFAAPPGYLARIRLNNPAEVEKILKRAEAYYVDNKLANDLPPIVFVLHGPEVEIFNRNNYSKHKNIVDLAARLQAFNVVDVRVCKTRMSIMDEQEENLYPFVGTVPFGPAEVERLMNDEKFIFF